MRLVSKYSKTWCRFAVVWLTLLSAVTAFADTSKISPDLLPLLSGPRGNVNVIIQYNTPPQQQNTGLIGGLLGVVGAVVNLLGGIVNTVFSLIPAISATVDSGNLLAISHQSNVGYRSPDRALAGTLGYPTAPVSAPYAWNIGLERSGSGIAIIDTG